ncbi:hypothetical protein [Streptomyces sasae]|uniref:hypothetical protein n=1 Tax=Streptomyces sasae TaxID=1266772 RepID=UPI00374225D1
MSEVAAGLGLLARGVCGLQRDAGTVDDRGEAEALVAAGVAVASACGRTRRRSPSGSGVGRSA